MELPDTILKGDHLRTIQAKFGWIDQVVYDEKILKIIFLFSYELLTFADFDRLCKLRINKQKNNFKNLLVINHLVNSTKLGLNGP
jgi:hypothetical protein